MGASLLANDLREQARSHSRVISVHLQLLRLAAFYIQPNQLQYVVANSSISKYPTAVTINPTLANCLAVKVCVPRHTMFCGALIGRINP